VKPRRSRARGFTLIEIMVVVVIIGLLAAVILPNIMDRLDDAAVSKTKQDIQQLQTALTMYRLDNFSYPTTEQGLRALVEEPADGSAKNWKKGGYVQNISKDPWKNDYLYENPGKHGKDYDLYSLGKDGKPDGEGTDADIGNWNLGQ
jgi:general secretion pathway protein G